MPGRIPKRLTLPLVSGAMIAVIVLAVAAGSLVRSPQQHLADTEPPAPTVLTAPVEFRVLSDTVVTRGLVTAGDRFEVTPTPPEGTSPVVTAVAVAAGDAFDSGAVLVEIAGRPLIALPGDIPPYRDLLPGAEGSDVSQLQHALADLGFDPGETDGSLGTGTKDALEELYASLGYPPPLYGDARAVTDAQRTVTAAERTVEQAQAELDLLREAPEPDEQAVANAERQVEWAREDLAYAEADLSQTEAATGAMLPLSEVVFLPSFPARVDAITAQVGTEVAAPLITVSSGALEVQADLNPGQRALLDLGMPVEVFSELDGVTAAGTIAAIGELESDEAGLQFHRMTVAPTEDAFAPGLAGQDVRLTVETAATEEEVLVVPVAALFGAANGTVTVIRVLADEQTERVEVAVGTSGDGYVEVAPVAGALSQGDMVLLGSAGDA